MCFNDTFCFSVGNFLIWRLYLHEYMYWEHQNNRAIRWRDWKAIRDEKGKEWELYDVVKDRTERFNVAEQHPEVLTRLVTEWERWAHANFVLPKHPKK